MDEDLEQMLQWEELNLNMVYSACMWQFVWQTVSVCVRVCLAARHGQMLFWDMISGE